jgi:hypothetical protein
VAFVTSSEQVFALYCPTPTLIESCISCWSQVIAESAIMWTIRSATTIASASEVFGKMSDVNLPDACNYSSTNLFDCQVAGTMSESVVYGFEVVNVSHDDGYLSAVAL